MLYVDLEKKNQNTQISMSADGVCALSEILEWSKSRSDSRICCVASGC